MESFEISKPNKSILPPVITTITTNSINSLSTVATTSTYNPMEKNGKKKSQYETQYFEIIEKILSNGALRIGRSNILTLAIFDGSITADLTENSFPLLTSKKMSFKNILGELLWFISGSTDVRILENQGINIWSANASTVGTNSEILNSKKENFDGITNKDLGPIYGFQWRHFGAKYIDCNTDYTGLGFDQLASVVEQLKHDRYNRRIIISAWNPNDIALQNLPPCHCFVQFHVDANDFLYCNVYQRSADVGLGLPYNVASYSLLTIMLARLANLKPKQVKISIGDCHIYVSHNEKLMQQKLRKTHNLPKLFLRERDYLNIDDFKNDDFILTEYNHEGLLYLPMEL